MVTKYSNKTGDVHAPVEDTEVPTGIKVLVFLMAAILIGTTVTVSLMIQASGLTNVLLQQLP